MTLRDTIEAAVNTAETAQAEQAPVQKEPVIAQPEVKAEVKAEPETEAQKADRTAGRKRDEHGRLLPGKAEKPEPQVSAPVIPAKPASPPPSSWKKDHWESWNKIASENPQLADYLNQREGEFAKGVSTYKQEYDSVRPLQEAIQPFLPELQRNGVQPAQWIQMMGTAHQRLLYGSPQEKLQMFAKLSQDYGVPLQALYDPQVQQQFLMQQTMQPPVQQPDVGALVQEKFTEMAAKNDLQQFEAAKDASGNPLYPHYEAVRSDMALLLESGKAPDLKSAYEKAIRMNDDIWTAEQAAKQAAAQSLAQTVQTKQVLKAKAAAVSPRTATPGAGQTQTTTGRRAAIEAAVEAHSGGGRV